MERLKAVPKIFDGVRNRETAKVKFKMILEHVYLLASHF